MLCKSVSGSAGSVVMAVIMAAHPWTCGSPGGLCPSFDFATKKSPWPLLLASINGSSCFTQQSAEGCRLQLANPQTVFQGQAGQNEQHLLLCVWVRLPPVRLEGVAFSVASPPTFLTTASRPSSAFLRSNGKNCSQMLKQHGDRFEMLITVGA